MRKISSKSSLEEVAAIVCEALKTNEIDCVLTGGAVVSIYTKNRYESFDLDFILPGLAKNVAQIMENLGFRKDGTRHWIHPHSPYFVEFPGSILSIGDSTDVDIVERKTKAGTIKLLTPTSSVMDRLAAFYYWDDRQSFDQAVAIATHHPVSIEKVKKWSKQERQLNKFEEFFAAFKKAKKTG